MYHADLIGGMAARLSGGIPMAWGIRHSDPSSEGYGWLTRATVRMCARASGWLPDRIVCCSEASRQAHAELGYDAKKMMVIPNGFDLDALKPNPCARASIRSELGLAPDIPVVGLVGRFHPQKDHYTFVRAASLLHRMNPAVHYVLCGEHVVWENLELAKWIDREGLRRQFHLLGRRDDIPDLNTAFDIATSSSAFGESFSNVVSEAMSCGVPCVVTNVGDAAYIVGNTGLVVPPKNPAALAKAWHTLMNLGQAGRMQLGRAARRRVEERFSLPHVVDQYQELFENLAGSRTS
jgi:glycosyltransferase involved in cell wall biosynthesis